jgi:Leucine-rich repeat (LRR) protein
MPRFIVIFNTRLNVYGNSLTGPLPTELGALTDLVTLDLSENKFTGTLPSEIGLLTSLRTLAIHQSEGNLGGALPAFDTFPQLKGLFLESNKFSGTIPENFLMGIIDKSSEITISLASNSLTGSVPESLGNFANLILDLEDNQIRQ